MDPEKHVDPDKETEPLEKSMQNLSIQDDFNQACQKGDTTTVKSLLAQHEKTINVDNCDGVEHPALYVAITSTERDPELIEALFLAGANPNILVSVEDETWKLKRTRTIFQHLIFNHGDAELELVKSFLDHGADILAQDGDGNTAFAIALQREHPNTVREILNHALANPKLSDHKQFYQLCNFVINDDLEGAKALMGGIRDIFFNAMEEITPLRFALRLNKLEFTKIFIDSLK